MLSNIGTAQSLQKVMIPILLTHPPKQSTMSDLLAIIKDKLYLREPLEPDTMNVLGEFLLLWSIYESKYFNSEYSNTTLKQYITEGKISIIDVGNPLRYLTERYLDSEENVNQTFEKLHFRRGDYPIEIRRTLERGGTHQEITLAILVIIYRLRNNLFHGIKEVAIFNMQKDNFRMASAVLTEIISRKAFLY